MPIAFPERKSTMAEHKDDSLKAIDLAAIAASLNVIKSTPDASRSKRRGVRELYGYTGFATYKVKAGQS